MSHRPSFEIAIAGAGLIGLTLALELHSRGLSVAVIDAAQPMRGASVAAAGMLAANDPHNPAVLGPFARHSLSLYPAFLDRLSSLSGLPVPFQTELTIQFLSDGTSTLLPERSVDPRQLAAAVLASARAVGITILENTGYPTLIELPDHVRILPQHGPELSAAQLVHASGAWFSGTPAIRPRKGQM
ncbi:MAG TPA: FAD-dependent oxidoreductase, partial [Acidobacteriaceae bacterium]|nr:FAD-dependent oxidoreductase [Acidobacteriaceae bacterium]